MKKYELKLKENKKRNEEFLKIFESWLNEQKLRQEIVIRHLNIIDFYINEYLNYYAVTKMEIGVKRVYSFLNDWIIKYCLWTTITTIKQHAASIKKFYQCMSEKGYVKPQDYESVCRVIKYHMHDFKKSLKKYGNYGEYEEWKELEEFF